MGSEMCIRDSNNTLDVLDCGDLEKVVMDCAEDCINVITDLLEILFKQSNTGSKNLIGNNVTKDESSSEVIKNYEKVDENIIPKDTPDASRLQCNSTKFDIYTLFL